MPKKRIIPCLDTKLDEMGKPMVVKGIEFERLRYAGDPVELAELYSLQGADELVFLDISASIENRNTMIEAVKMIAEVVNVPLTVGGGIKSIRDIELILAAGADKVSINTAAVKNPALIKEAAQKFGSDRIVSAIDCKRIFEFDASRNMIELENGSKAWFDVVIYSGKQHTGIDAVEWAKQVEKLGAGEILLTSKDRDGTKLGYDIPITRAIAQAVKIPVIASGGLGKLEHFYEAFINGASACLAASIFHYGDYTIKEVKEYLHGKGVEI
jgi:cyclase